MTRALILTGGIFHPFERAAPALAAILQEAGFATWIGDDLNEALERLREDPQALFVVYALRWSMTQHAKYEPHRARWALTLAPSARDAMTSHVVAGGGLLGLHTASICFDDWDGWREVLGGAWRWGRSWHPEPGPAQVTLNPQHPLARGLADFTLADEVYSDLELAADIEVAAWAQGLAPGGRATGSQPALWTHRHGLGRAVYDALGHDETSLQHPVHRRLLQRAALWASGRTQDVVEAA